jgi:hypothetical protein
MSIQCQRVWKSWLRFPRNHHVFLLSTIITPVVLAYSLHHATINSYVGHQSFRIFFLLHDVTSRPAHNITTAASFACADHSSQQTACSRVVLGKDAASFTLLTCCLLLFCRSPRQQAKQERAVVVGVNQPAPETSGSDSNRSAACWLLCCVHSAPAGRFSVPGMHPPKSDEK